MATLVFMASASC